MYGVRDGRIRASEHRSKFRVKKDRIWVKSRVSEYLENKSKS